jgi:hypothetical protein
MLGAHLHILKLWRIGQGKVRVPERLLIFPGHQVEAMLVVTLVTQLSPILASAARNRTGAASTTTAAMHSGPSTLSSRRGA